MTLAPEPEHEVAAPRRTVAYFSMEIALDSAIPTYAGGLGVLAGDTVRAAADHGIPMVAVSLVHREGYFRQQLDADGTQREEPRPWAPETRVEAAGPVVEVEIGGRPVAVRAWRWREQGIRGREVPVYLLDTRLEPNDAEARALTDRLYGGDARHRLAQEAVLGLGGVAFLRALGEHSIATWHMNEGHSALLTLALLEEWLARGEPAARAVERVRSHCVFTTHTPVPAGHDKFPAELAEAVLGPARLRRLAEAGYLADGTLNMTYVALRAARFVNGVALRHREVSSGMFPEYPVGSITNGVHAGFWASRPFQALFDRHVPEWRRQNLNLRYVTDIDLAEIRAAHAEARRILFDRLAPLTDRLAPERFTIGFARRAAAYKRAALLFEDLDRLRAIAGRAGPFQVVFAGKAHPRDEVGKEQIRRVFRAVQALGDDVVVAYLPDYGMDLARDMCAGCDLWLNTPRRPQEASGTSGMKAALNGVPSLSVLDGWWVEGHVEGVTGWSIGDHDTDERAEGRSLYDKLETIVRLYHEAPDAYAEVMRSAIALNGSFFNAERMIFQYAGNAYGL